MNVICVRVMKLYERMIEKAMFLCVTLLNYSDDRNSGVFLRDLVKLF